MTDDDVGFPNTRLLMSTSAAFMALVGFAAAVFSNEIVAYFGLPPEGFAIVLVKMVAGLYFGLAILNWMARGNLIGGIYSRPVALANFAHFLAIAIVLLKQVPSAANPTGYAVTAGLNGMFAAAFGFVTFGRSGGRGASCG